jgi:hypothetical protein
MKRLILALGTLVALTAVFYAQESKAVKIEGYIMDNACASAHSKDANFGDKIKKHTTSCALMPNCAETGYVVYTADKKLYKLDKNGNESAEALLKDSKTTAGVAVVVEGTIDGDTIKVTKISEKTE